MVAMALTLELFSVFFRESFLIRIEGEKKKDLQMRWKHSVSKLLFYLMSNRSKDLLIRFDAEKESAMSRNPLSFS